MLTLLRFFVLMASAWCAALPCFADASTRPRRPNIVLIYADDLGYGDLSCYGATRIETPHLDRLARSGLRFTSAYATASTCTPSRYSLLTGQYAFRNRDAVILPGNAPLIIDPAMPTIASLLKERGYATGLVGKWHLGLGVPEEPLDWNKPITPGPREVGFDYSFHMAATGDRVPTVFIENGRVVGLDSDDPIKVSYEKPLGDEPTGVARPELLKTPADKQHGATIVDGTSRIGYMTGGAAARWTDEEMPDRFLHAALEFIESNQEQPFFLYYATHENHVPRIPHPRFRGASGVGARGDAVVQLDWSIGEMLDTLERLKITDKTLVIFTSDNGSVLFDGYDDGAAEQNGDHRPSGPWRGGKYSAWEGGTRIPLLVAWPGVVRPAVTDALMSQLDFFASFAALTNTPLPEGVASDSENHLNALLGHSQTGRDYVVEQGVGIFGVRSGNWKYLPPGKVTSRESIDGFNQTTIAAPGALYDLLEDPEEFRNVIRDHPARAAELRKLLEETVGESKLGGESRDQLGGAQPR